MNCGEFEKVASLYLDGEFDASERAEVNEHLAHCDDCRAMVDSEHRFRQTLRDKLKPVTAPGYLRQRIVSQIDELDQRAESRLRWSVWAEWVGAASVLVAAAVVVVVVWPNTDSLVPLNRTVDSTPSEVVANTVPSLSMSRPALFDGSAVMPASYSVSESFKPSNVGTAGTRALASYQRLPADVRGNGRMVRRYMQSRLSFPVELPLSESQRVQLIGARQVNVDGGAAALFIYKVDGERVSVLQQSARNVRHIPLRLQRRGTITVGEFGRQGVHNTVVSELDTVTLSSVLTRRTARP
jgi:mycothiol system anti-sigma-R factor